MGEGGSSTSFFVSLLLCMLVFHSKMVHADVFTVGDTLGWHFGVQSWPVGKSFQEGDKLAFYYVPSTHNVLVVDQNTYNNCLVVPITTPGNGSEVFTLSYGMSYFICGYPSHCESGMRIAINATASAAN